MAAASPEPSATPSWAVRKMRTVVEAPTPSESGPLREAVRFAGELSGGRGESGAVRAKALGRELEWAAVETSEEVLEALRVVRGVQEVVRACVVGMAEDVETLKGRLEVARDGARGVVEETGAIRGRLASAESMCVVSTAFVRRFVLTDAEKKVLEGDIVNGAFITALKRIEAIHSDSHALLRCREQRAGLEALECAATMREEAYEKVFRFVQARCGELDVDAQEQEEEAALLREAIRALRARPMLLRFCAEEVGSARRASLVSRFVTALTKGGPGGVPRPIEMHAHDPMRYTNDMLAWIHQALASEKELTARLFTADASDPDDARTKVHNDELALKVLNTVFDALCRPFRIRFEQALEQTLPVVVLYRLASLLEFYSSTMSRLLGPTAALPEMLMECNSIAMYGFFSAWKSKMESFRVSGVGPSDDLNPPAAVHQSMTRLDEIMATLDASLTPVDARQGQIAAVLEVILNPLLSLCDSMSSRTLSPVDQQIFLANCIDSMRMPLMAYPFAAARVQQLTASADAHIDQYIRLSTVIVLRRCGLADRARILSEVMESKALENAELASASLDPAATSTEVGDSTETSITKTSSPKRRKPLSQVPGMDVEALSISVKNFYAMLFGGATVGSSEALQPPNVSKITNVRARNRAKSAVAECLAKTHEDFYNAVLEPLNDYGPDAVRAVGLRDPKKVSLILTNGQ